MVFLPFADDLVNFVGEKTVAQPQTISGDLVDATKCFINNTTVENLDLRNFENPALQKFYSHIQANALNEEVV